MKKASAKRNMKANRGSALFKNLAAGLIIAALILLMPAAAWAEKDEPEEDHSQDSEREDLTSRTGLGSLEAQDGKPLPGIEIGGVEIHPVLEWILGEVVDPRTGGTEPDHFGINAGDEREGVFGVKDPESLGVDNPTDSRHTFGNDDPDSRMSGGNWNGRSSNNNTDPHDCLPLYQDEDGYYDAYHCKDSDGSYYSTWTDEDGVLHFNFSDGGGADSDDWYEVASLVPQGQDEPAEEEESRGFLRRLWDSIFGGDNGGESSDNSGTGSTGSDNPDSDDDDIEITEPVITPCSESRRGCDDEDDGGNTCECEGTCSCGDNSNNEQGCEAPDDGIGPTRGNETDGPIKDPNAEGAQPDMPNPGYDHGSGTDGPIKDPNAEGAQPDMPNPGYDFGSGAGGWIKDPHAEGAQPDMPNPGYDFGSGAGGWIKDPNAAGTRFDPQTPRLDFDMKQPGKVVESPSPAGTFDRAPSGSFNKAPIESGSLLQDQVAHSGGPEFDRGSLKKAR